MEYIKNKLFNITTNITKNTNNNQNPNEVVILSFNLWNGGQSRNITPEQYADFIKSHNVDVACLQETSSWEGGPDDLNYIIKENIAPVIAKILGWNVYIQRTSGGYSTAILSKFNHSQIFYLNDEIIAVEFEVLNKKKIIAINDHLTDEPYEYERIQTHNIKKPEKLRGESVKAAYEVRAKPFLEKIKHVLDTRKDIHTPIFITGDFNEPSWLDWTKKATENNLSPCELEWPTSKLIYKQGFIDSFRKLYPDEVKYHVDSYSVAEEDKDYYLVFDRLDFIYHMNTNVKSVKYVDSNFSDHLAVVGTYSLDPHFDTHLDISLDTSFDSKSSSYSKKKIICQLCKAHSLSKKDNVVNLVDVFKEEKGKHKSSFNTVELNANFVEEQKELIKDLKIAEEIKDLKQLKVVEDLKELKIDNKEEHIDFDHKVLDSDHKVVDSDHKALDSDQDNKDADNKEKHNSTSNISGFSN